ncbi:MAG: Ldh family oxidoreductase [Acutalibacteraceae bacterium]
MTCRREETLGRCTSCSTRAALWSLDAFKQSLSQELDELAAVPPAEGYGKVYYPGERSAIRKEKADAEGVEIVEEIVEYLKGRYAPL